MSFDESVFSAGFIQKTAKEDLIIKENYEIPPRHRCGKDLEDTTLKLGPKGHNSGLASPLGRPPSLLQSPIALPFDVDSSTALRIISTLLCNVGLI